jgi:hypothetical protein
MKLRALLSVCLLIGVAAAGLQLAGCEVIAEFDRTLIDAGQLAPSDGSAAGDTSLPSADGSADTSVAPADASVPDSTTVPDGSTPTPEGGADAADTSVAADAADTSVAADAADAADASVDDAADAASE